SIEARHQRQRRAGRKLTCRKSSPLGCADFEQSSGAPQEKHRQDGTEFMINEHEPENASHWERNYPMIQAKIDYAAPMSPQIYEILRRAIIENRIAPGTPIYEAKLSEALGVSRTPLRSALQQLAKENLIETRPQVGSIVAPVNEGKILSAVFCRGALETAVV